MVTTLPATCVAFLRPSETVCLKELCRMCAINNKLMCGQDDDLELLHIRCQTCNKIARVVGVKKGNVLLQN